MYTLKVNSLHYKGLPNFPRAMLIRVMALEKKIFHCSAETRGPTMVGAPRKSFDFGKPRSLENAFLSVWFASIYLCKYGWC